MNVHSGPTLWKRMLIMKKSSRKLSEACGQSKWKKTSVKSSVRNWKLGSQKDERSSFSPATVVSRTSQLEAEATGAKAFHSVSTMHTHTHTSVKVMQNMPRCPAFASTYWIPSFLRWLSAKPSLVSALSTMAGYTTYFSKHSRPT